MATLSNNFGLTILDPGVDSLASNGFAFITSNIVTIDAALALGRDHHHTAASSSITNPTTGPTVTLDTTQGNLPGGTRIYYRFSYVDQFGNETAASNTTFVDTPATIGAPLAPDLLSATTGGSLQGGLYFYAFTAYTGVNAQETVLGTLNNISVAFATATNVVTVGLPSVPSGADGFNLYRRAPGEAEFNYLASIDMTVATPPVDYTDDGATNPNCSRQPPLFNATSQQNAVDVALPGATPTVPADVTWKIYRSYDNGNWFSSNLHHVVEETFLGSGIIDPTYLDLGFPTGFERAPETSGIISQPSKILFTDAAEVQGTLPVGFNIVPFEITFSYGGPLAVDTGTSVWRCPFDKAQIQEISCTLGRGFAPASTDVIVDVNKFDTDDVTPTYGTIYTTQANRPTVPVGDQIGVATVPDIVDLTKNDLISVDIDQIGGGATPTDEDLIVTVYMYVQSGSLTTSVTI